MSPLIAKLARIASPALKLMTLLVLAITAWIGVSVEMNTSLYSQDARVAYVSVGDVKTVNAATGDKVDAKKADATPAAPSALETAGLGLANSVIDLLFILFNPLLFLAGWLLTPDWVFGEVFGFRPVLHQFWVLISNIVYVVFAFLLVGIAFMNIFGSEQSAWQMKTKLPKLIIGIISVPFTWFFVSAITSIASFLTASVIQIPGDMITDASTKAITFNVPSKCSIDFTKSAVNQTAEAGATAKDGMVNCTPWTGSGKTLGELFSSKSAYGMLTAYAYGIYKFQDIKVINGTIKGSIKNISDITIGLISAMIFFFVFLLLILALVFALFTRGIMLWVYAMFSPLLSLAYFFEWKLPGGLDDKFGITKVISLALVPVFVAAALSFGMLFLQMAQAVDINGKSEYVKQEKCENGKKECSAFTFTDTKFEITGALTGVSGLKNDTKDLGLNLFGRFMINILGLIVLWMAVMAALKSNKITEDAVKPVAEFGESIGKLMKSLPKMIPIIPTPHGAMGLQGLSNLGQNFSSEIMNAGSRKGAKLGTEWWQRLTGSTDTTRSDIEDHLRGIGWLKTKSDVGNRLTKSLDTISKNMDYGDFVRNKEVRDEFAKGVANIDVSVIDENTKKAIVAGIQSGDEDKMAKALKDLEHKLEEGNFGGRGADFGTPDATKKWFNDKHKNAKSWASTDKKTDEKTDATKPNIGNVVVNIGTNDKEINLTGTDAKWSAVKVNIQVNNKEIKSADIDAAATSAGVAPAELHKAIEEKIAGKDIKKV